ncbi:MAG: PLP-dependent aminotransferase family protein [Exilispira sp.]|jgi:2-aminoadipate transaminase|nr:PLP-dependent aminotransferase family protein [Exilispira sp.]
MSFNDEMFESHISIASSTMKRSVIRELLKLVEKPEIISFAGGLPAPTTFPVDELKDIVTTSLSKYGNIMLQYGSTEGDSRLKRLLLKRFMDKTSVKNLNENNILVVSASQQALDMVGKLFIDRDDLIMVENPSYLGGLSAFRAYGAKMIGVDLEDDGINIEQFEEKLNKIYNSGKKIKFFYTIPDFQNPAGVCTSLEKRKKIIEIADKYDFMIIEDAPYKELRYEKEDLPYLYELDPSGRVIGLFTFSKIYCPGLRLGWIIAHPKVIDKLVIIKQAVDLCTAPFNQIITAEYMERGLLEGRIQKNIELYRKRKNLMLNAFEKYFPNGKGIKWTKPEGGLFLWVSLPENINTEELFFDVIKNNVAYVIGSAFYGDEPKYNSFRMNFSYPTEDKIEEGVKRLGEVLKKKLS